MTVQATSPIHTYVYSGPGTYNFDFRVFQETDVVVTHYNSAANEPTILTRGTDYSITLNAGGVGGKVSTTYSVTSGRLELKRQLERTQIEDLENADDFDQDALERGLDRLVMMLQEMDTVITGATTTTNWKGNWAAGTKYLLREIVAAPSGDWYACAIAHTASADFSADLSAGYWTFALKVSDIETMRDEVEADRAEVEANKNTVAANTATVATDKDEVHSDRLAVEAIAGDIPNISTATSGQVLVVNDAKDGYDFSWVGLGQMPSGVEMEGSFVGGDYWNGADTVNDIDITQFVFPSHDNTDIIASTGTITGATDATGANGMLGGAKQANDVLDIWALKGTSGVCIGFTRNGSETITGVTLPSGYADSYKWVGTTGKLNVTNLPKIVCMGDLFSYLDATEAAFFSGDPGTTYSACSLSGILPDNRYSACLFGVNDNDGYTVCFSQDGVKVHSVVRGDIAIADDLWGHYGATNTKMLPIKNNQIYARQNGSNATMLLVQTAKLRR